MKKGLIKLALACYMGAGFMWFYGVDTNGICFIFAAAVVAVVASYCLVWGDRG